MDISVIQPYFYALSGLSSSQAQAYEPLLRAAAVAIDARCVSTELTDQKDLDAAAYAAAALAFRDYTALCVASEPSFAAGDIKVTRYDGRVQAAECILRDALHNAAYLFADQELCFERVVS